MLYRMNASVIAAYGNYTNCKASCGASCTSRQDISSAVSITKFPSDASNKNLLDMIAKQKNLDLADNNLILLDIYHSSMG